jgi:hypothetical protein
VQPALQWNSNEYYILFVCVCVCATLAIQQAKRIHRIVLPSVACRVVHFLPILSHKRLDFRKAVIEHQMCFHFLYNFYLKPFSSYEKISEIL